MVRKENSFYFVIGLILIASFSRIIPHYPNFTPLIAISLFGGKYFENRTLAFFLPVFILWLSDLVINNFILDYYKTFTFIYPGFYWQYFSILLISFIGRNYLNKISRCVLTGTSVDYGEGGFTTFRQFDPQGAAPVSINMTLSFTEAEILTKDMIIEGY